MARALKARTKESYGGERVNETTLYNPYQQSMLASDTTDAMLIELWLKTDKADGTQEGYIRDIQQFLEYVEVPLQELKYTHVLHYAEELKMLPLAPVTIGRKINTMKSLLTFAQKMGYCQFNVGTMIKPPKYKRRLAERILPKDQILSMIFTETNTRNHLILRVLYATGIRVSELCQLTWRDVQANQDGGQITVFGKGSKTRTVLVPKATYEKLLEYRRGVNQDTPIFPSRGGGRGHAGDHLDPSQVKRIVERAAIRLRIETYQGEQIRQGVKKMVTHSRVSPHWFRHAHASHALDEGAPISLVKETFGHEKIDTTALYTHARPGTSSSQYIKGV